MDVSMPVLDGIAATKEIRGAGLMQIPIIARLLLPSKAIWITSWCKA
jgi:hypothetical protein